RSRSGRRLPRAPGSGRPRTRAAARARPDTAAPPAGPPVPGSRAHSGMERDAAASEEPVADVAEAACLEEPREVLRTGEATDARGQVGVRLAARQEAAGERDQRVEPDAEEQTEDAARARDLEDRDLPARSQHPRELAEAALQIVEVAHSEPNRRRIE